MTEEKEITKSSVFGKVALRQPSLPNLVDALCIVFLLSFYLLWLWPFLRAGGNIGLIPAPFLPVFSLSFARIFSVDSHQVRVALVLISQLLGTVSFYFFLRELTGRRLPGLMVAFFYALPVNLLALDRLRYALILGDGAHIAALGLFPLICYFLLTFLKRGGATYGFATSLSIALVGLINAFALFNLLLFLVVILISEIILGQAKVKLVRFLMVILFAWGFLSFWYTPGMIRALATSNQGRLILSLFGRLVPLSFFIGPIILVFGYLIFESREGLQPIALALGFFVIYLFLNFIEHFAYADVERFVLLPRRFLPELGLSLAFVLGTAATIFFDGLGELTAFGKFILPRSDRQAGSKRGVSLLFLIIIWFLGMAVAYLFLPTSQVLESIRTAASHAEVGIGEFWAYTTQHCLSGCPKQVDSLVGLSITLVTFGAMVIMVIKGKRKDI